MTNVLITELDDIEADRVDGVDKGANGFPILLMKGIRKDPKSAQGWPSGDDDDWPAMTADTSRPGPDGHTNDPEGCGCCDMCDGDSACTCCDACECGPETLLDPMTLDTYKSAEADVYKRDVSTAERKQLASEGKALKDGSYPIANKGDLDNAASLARSGHGNVAAAKRLIARRARELGVTNPLEENSDSKKGQQVPEVTETPETTEPQAETLTKAGVDEIVKAAVTEATGELKKAVEGLEARLAKVEDTPIPGGPAVTGQTTTHADTSKVKALSKAAYWDRMAENTTDQEMRREYTKRAADVRKSAGITPE